MDEQTPTAVVTVGNRFFACRDADDEPFVNENVAQEVPESCRWLVGPKPLENVLQRARSFVGAAHDFRQDFRDEVFVSLELS